MKKILQFFVALLVIFSTVSVATTLAQEQSTPDTQSDVLEYQALAPLPGFSDKIPVDLGSYVNNLYTLSISLGAIAAIFMIVIGGMQYMTTDNFNNKKDGRARINNALLGLGILLAAFLILNTLNSDLIRLDVELRSAQVQGEIDDFNELLNENNIETFLDQQAAVVEEYLANGYTPGGCALDGNWVRGNKVDLGDKRRETVNVLRNQMTECGGELEQKRAANKTTSYTNCAAVYNGSRVQTCYFERPAVAVRDCPDCAPITNAAGVVLGGNVCSGTNAGGRTCQMSKTLQKPLEATVANLPGVQVTVTEGYPPTIPHNAACHKNGTCIDFDINPDTPENIYIAIETWENTDGQAFFEVKTQDDKDKIINALPELQRDLANRRICVFPPKTSNANITGSHFSGYQSKGIQKEKNCVTDYSS